MAAVIVAAVLATVGGCTAHANGAAAVAAKPVNCEYWTTAGDVSAVVVTSGANCGPRSFKISAVPYDGAVFSDTGGATAYNQFLSQISEFVHGPASAPAPFGGKAPSVRGLTLIGSADNEFTNHIPVYVYKGPGDIKDDAAQALDALINNTFLQSGQAGPSQA